MAHKVAVINMKGGVGKVRYVPIWVGIFPL